MRILLPQTKNGEGRGVYLNQSAMNVNLSIERTAGYRQTERVISGIWPEKVRTSFGRARDKAKIEDFRFHDLRHTAASWLRMTGADTHTVGQILGHKDPKMAARYQHLSPTFLAEAVGKLDAVFDLNLTENGEERYQDVTGKKALVVKDRG